MELGIKGKVALVTGSGSQIGMGKAIALTLAKEGCDVACVDIDLDGATKTAAEIKALGKKAFAYKVDVSKQDDVKNCVAAAIKDLGKIDILVNTAGGTAGGGPLYPPAGGPPMGPPGGGPPPGAPAGARPPAPPAATISQEDKWYRDIGINFYGPLYFSKAVLPGMTERKWGKIVNFSSAVAINGMAGSSSYAGAKAAVMVFTKCLAQEVGPSNINVNCLAPTMVLTNFGTHAQMAQDAKRVAEMAQRLTLRRMTSPQDIANTVLYLVSDMSSSMTGQCLSI